VKWPVDAVYMGEIKERVHLGDIDADGRITVKWIIGDVINTEYRNIWLCRDQWAGGLL
jgi:hypothetical protein